MFFGRENELKALENMHERNNFQMAVVYGRRRIGKTALISEFVSDKKSIYFSCEEVNDALNLAKFSQQLGELLGISGFPPVENWEVLFTIIAENFGHEHLVVVIDEYPYAASANRSLNSTLQHIIDHKFKNTNLFLILCGSSVSFMENQVLGEKSPLFGRRTGQIKVNALDYYDASKFYPDVSFEDKIRYYATIGGTPYYLSMIDPSLTFEENLKNLYFVINGYLFNEGTLLMKQEFREPAIYNSVLQAIASGAVTLSGIAGFTKLETSLISKYLLTLQELNYIERIIPFGSNPLKGKKSYYHITENFIAYWYRTIFSIRTEIERGHGDIYWQHSLNNLSEFIGPIFEEITRQYLRRVNAKNGLPFIAKTFGKWWGKDKKGDVQEIDIIVESLDGKNLIIGECKWTNSLKLSKTLQTLDKRATLFSDYTVQKMLFTKNAVETGDIDVKTISICDYFNL
ncbi:hypothetical protein AOC36_06880 [Erysipelothrix larvae]|uniref:ATPase n=1 Tax=Erysipelothrix larvae TaxID=1514105 RepID=A0A0X8H095_9FIRM|nr:ATP-binding protein [Erysipelothrix larvae]AMC93715.1 hypothetical protein AOC36_06880 [Erysipelothrix larvae]